VIASQVVALILLIATLRRASTNSNQTGSGAR
jgi:hypothetical protein